jgi:hypothetical protein
VVLQPKKSELMTNEKVMAEKDILLKSENFCMLPWSHLHFWPDSSAHLCCISDSNQPIGKYTGSLEAVYNSEKMKTVRKNMLENKPSPECTRCYQLEKNGIYSLRKTANAEYGKHFNAVGKTQTDGSVSEFNMRYLDIRFSNKCSFKCRSCGPMLSSSWYNDQVGIYGSWHEKQIISIEEKEKFWNDLVPHLGNIQEAYFAGGEPLITDEVYDIMDHWLEINHWDVQIGFTTNFSNFNYKTKNIIEYWKKFPRIVVSASIDDSGPRAEYMRKGTNWAKIVENRKQMLEQAPEIKFEITPTISVFNVWHFPDFHLDWIENGLVSEEDLRLNLLTSPASMAINIIHPDKRKPIIEKWIDSLYKIAHLKNINLRFYNKTVTGYQSVIHALRNEPYNDFRKEFFERNDKVDAFRNEKLYEIFPELKEILS